MLHKLGEIKKLWHLVKNYKIGIIIAVVIAVFVAIYMALPYPTIEGADEKGTAFKVSFNAPFTLHFSGMMNEKSVEQAFKISPKIDGSFNWPDRKTLEYKPSSALKIDDRYRVIIGGGAGSIFGKKLGSDATLRFIVTGPPYVEFVSPKFTNGGADCGANCGTVDNQQPAQQFAPQSEIPVVSPNQIVTVMFDRPMQWPDFSDVSPEETLLVIEPMVKGKFRFLGMSAFQFTPESWPMGTSFKLTVPSGIQARDGGETEKEFSWNFETPPLMVAESNMKPEIAVDINSPIILRFNQQVDLDQIKPGVNALLYPSNDLDAETNPKTDGFFNTEVTYGENSDGKQDKSILVFKPTFPYLYGKEYKFVLKAGFGSASPDKKGPGTIGMKEDSELVLKTVLASGVAELSPPSLERPGIIVKFSTPMTVEEIRKSMLITPPPIAKPDIVLDETNTEAEILFDYLPNTDYVFEFREGTMDMAGNEIKKAFKQSFKTPVLQLGLKWQNPDEMEFFVEGMKPEFTLRTENVKELSLNLCEISGSEFMDINQKSSWKSYNCSGQNKRFPLTAKSNVAVLNPAFIFKTDFTTGIYYFSAETEDAKAFKVFIVTNITLVLKKSSGGALVWASDALTGEPVTRMELTFYDFDGNKIIKGVTDGDGIYKITRELGEGVYAIGEKDLGGESKWGIINEYWLLPVKNAFSSDNYEWLQQGQDRVYFTADRNSVHSGEQFNIKGIWRVDTDAQLTLPEEKRVSLSLDDIEGNQVIKNTIPLRRDGSFDTALIVPTNTAPGTYILNSYASSSEKISSNEINITVCETNPPFEMKWVNAQKNYYAGEAMILDLQAHYMMGMPAASLKGEWALYRKPFYYDHHKIGAFFSFGGLKDLMCSKGICRSDEELVNKGEFMFNPNGFAKISLTKADSGLLDTGYEYLLVAISKSIEGAEVAETIRFKIHEKDSYVGLSIGHYILNPGDSAEGHLFVADADGNFIGGKKVRLTLTRTKNEQEGKVWFDKTFGPGADVADISIPINSNMPGGTYKLKAETPEGSYAELEVYVVSENKDKLGDHFAILPDQPEYFVGGKAQFILHYPNASAEKPVKALVTYERGDILGYQMVEMSSPITTFEIPVREDMTPDMQISATVINYDTKKFEALVENQAVREKEVENMENEVKITLLEDELETLKKENVETSRGASLDEEKIKQMQEEIDDLKKKTEDFVGFNSEEGVKNDTENPLPTIETSNAVILISKPDRAINIDITSEPESPGPGEEVKLKIKTYDNQNRPVQAVVSVNITNKKIEPQTPFDFFYEPRVSQVFTSSDFYFSPAADEGYFPPILPEDDYVRETVDYSDYFNPIVLTDEGGYGEVVFTLSNRYAAWFINAIATNDAKNFGSVSRELSLKKHLLIRPIMPSFITPGDRVEIGAYIQNLSGENAETKIELLADDIDIKDSGKKSFSLKAGENTQFSWEISIKPSAYNKESLKITINSSDDSLSAVLPVKPFNISDIDGGSGILADKWDGKVRTPQNIIRDLGGLTVAVSGTPESITKSLINEIEDYSMSFTENLATRLLAKVLEKDLTVDETNLKIIDEEIKQLIAGIQARQNSDGGYAFWQNGGESSLWLTAYVMFALNNAGISDSQGSAVQYLLSTLNEAGTDSPFILWALSEVGQFDTSLTLTAFSERDTQSISGKAFLLMNIQNLVDAGQNSAYPFIEKLQAELTSDKYSEDDMEYFQEAPDKPMDTGIRSTAIALMALLRTSEDNPLTAPVAKYLASSAIDAMGRFNPQESIWLALALDEFGKNQADNPDCKVRVKVNGQNVQDGTIPFNSLRSPDDINDIEISKENSCALYYFAGLKYYPENDKISPMEEGTLITHGYHSLEDSSALQPLSRIQSGKLYRGVVTIIVPKDLYYVSVEENLPAGMRALSLNPAIANIYWKYQKEEKAKAEGVSWLDSPLWNFDNAAIADDKITFFAEKLPAGVYNIDYLAQSGASGSYNYLPAVIKQMFNPSIYARTSGGLMEIE